MFDFMTQKVLCKSMIPVRKSRRGHRMCAVYILECIEKIEYITSVDPELENPILYDATIRNLQTLAESTRYIQQKIRLQNPDIPWQVIRCLRNELVHSYLTLDMDEMVRLFIKNEMLTIKKILEELYPRWRKEKKSKRVFEVPEEIIKQV